MYQMRQWYKPLAELAETLAGRRSSAAPPPARALCCAEDAPPVAFVPTVRDLERFIAEQDIRVVLYVNQNTQNFQMFRYGRRWHVFINHGESDKMYMTTNQFKAYDYAFIAGDAARERLARVLWDYDLDHRAIAIGRPQADHYSGRAAVHARRPRPSCSTRRRGRATAPRRTTARSLTHGEALVRGAARDRAPPRHLPAASALGCREPRVRRREPADHRGHRGRERRGPASAHHVFDDGPELGWQLAAADVAIVDISAMVYDRLAADKPLMVTRPADPEALIDTHGYLAACEWLDAADAAARSSPRSIACSDDADAVARLEQWVQHYFGDTAPGRRDGALPRGGRRPHGAWDALAHARPSRTTRTRKTDRRGRARRLSRPQPTAAGVSTSRAIARSGIVTQVGRLRAS